MRNGSLPAEVAGLPPPLPRAFYRRPAPQVARALLGCVLASRRAGVLTAGRIVETEAYLGPEDAASHVAFRPASRSLFDGDGGTAYVFIAYGMHACLNAITGRVGEPGCVLIRALDPLCGRATMARRRGLPADSPRLASGPGNLTRALAVRLGDSGADLTAGPLTIHRDPASRAGRIAVGPRVGLSRAVDRPLRFRIAGHPCVSR